MVGNLLLFVNHIMWSLFFYRPQILIYGGNTL